LTRRDKENVKNLLPATNNKAMIAKSRHQILIKFVANFSSRLSRYSQPCGCKPAGRPVTVQMCQNQQQQG